MAKAIAFSREIAANPLDTLRIALVSTCGLALIAAGQVLPVAL